MLLDTVKALVDHFDSQFNALLVRKTFPLCSSVNVSPDFDDGWPFYIFASALVTLCSFVNQTKAQTTVTTPSNLKATGANNNKAASTK